MKKRHLDFTTWSKELLKDPKVKAAYDKLQPEYAIIRAILDAKIKKKLNQSQIAKKMKVKESYISRLESGSANPSLKILQKLAYALDSHLEIHFVPQ